MFRTFAVVSVLFATAGTMARAEPLPPTDPIPAMSGAAIISAGSRDVLYEAMARHGVAVYPEERWH